jgi:transcriptional regulator with XRE-family HTH domain
MNKLKKPNKKLQHERELYGWSQAKVAEKLGTTVKRVGMWECGDIKPDRYYQEKLIGLFGKNAEELGLLGQESGDDDDPQRENIEAASTPQEESVSARDTVSDASSSNQSIQVSVPQSLVHSSSSIHITVSLQERGETGCMKKL